MELMIIPTATLLYNAKSLFEGRHKSRMTRDGRLGKWGFLVQ